MPELPEVETIRRDLVKEIKGLCFQNVEVLDARVVRQMTPAAFSRALAGRKVRDVKRRGKAVLIDLDGRWLCVQPMMTGQLVVAPEQRAFVPARETRVIFRLSKRKVLIYNDQRLFGRLQVVNDPSDLAYIRDLGPEPLDEGFSVDEFNRRLGQCRSAIKTLLLNGQFIAGIGNIYAAEALFRSGIDPRRQARRLKPAEAGRLYQAIREVLKEAIRMRGTSMRNYRDGLGREGKYSRLIQVYAREGRPCRTCGTPVRRIVQAQRSTFFCPRCQR